MQTFHSFPPAERAVKPKRKPNKRALAVLSLFFTAMLAAVYLRSPLSKLQIITVEGNRQISSDTIEQKSGLKKDMNVWKINSSQVEQSLLKQFPLFASVKVQFSFPYRVVIQVQEKHTAALLMANGKFYHMLNDGTLLDEVPVSYGSQLPIVSSVQTIQAKVGQPVNNPDLVALANQLSSISPSQLSLFSDIEVRAADEWVANTLDGFEVKFASGHLADKLAIFEDFHKQLVNNGTKPGIINLIDRPVYSPYSSQKLNGSGANASSGTTGSASDTSGSALGTSGSTEINTSTAANASADPNASSGTNAAGSDKATNSDPKGANQ